MRFSKLDGNAVSMLRKHVKQFLRAGSKGKLGFRSKNRKQARHTALKFRHRRIRICTQRVLETSKTAVSSTTVSEEFRRRVRAGVLPTVPGKHAAGR